MRYDVHLLTEAIENALNAERIFDIDTYGWLSDEDVDPEFVGYAMWATSPPFEMDFERALEGEPSRWVATTEQQRLIELGTDFEGLMKAARHMIGLVLVHRQDLSAYDFQPGPFEFHEIGALVTLSMASDRVRDFVTMAVLEERPRNTHELDQYRLALCMIRNFGLNSDVDAFEALTSDIRALKDARNVTVHKLALKTTKVQRQLFERDRREKQGRKRRSARRGAWDAAAVAAAAKEQTAAHELDVKNRIALLRRSYDAVVKSGDLAFRLENTLRQRRAHRRGMEN